MANTPPINVPANMAGNAGTFLLMITNNNIGTKNNQGVMVKLSFMAACTCRILSGSISPCLVNPIIRNIIKVINIEGIVVYIM